MTSPDLENLGRLPIRRYYRTARGRFVLATVCAGLAWLAMAAFPLSVVARLLVACNVGIYAMLAFTWPHILHNSQRQTQMRAAAEDPGRRLVHLSVLASTLFSLVAVFLLLHEVTHEAKATGLFWLPVCFGATVGSWLLNHTSWTLHYAHLYYRDARDGFGGLTFPGANLPDDLDFAYFSFTIGMCFQVSDVTITDRYIRRAALFHAIQSFAFNTTIIALTLNVVYTLMS